MRELFRAVMKDGDISEGDRLALQNVALLLAQVDGKTWVNFADTQGALQDFTQPQLRLLRPFLEKVAKELKETETGLQSLDNGKEVIDVLQLADVPWADGITARELLGCCGPDEDLLTSNPVVGKVVDRLPSKYMLSSRVRELINYYYLKRCGSPSPAGAGDAPAAPPKPRSAPAAAAAAGAAALSSGCRGCLRRAGGGGRAAVGLFLPCIRGFRFIFSGAAMAVAGLVVYVAWALIAVLRAVWSLLPSRWTSSASVAEPFWPAMRFFGAALLHRQTTEVFKFLVMIARLRVFVCLGTCNSFFGWILYPLVVVVEKVLKLSKNNRLLGCVCDDSDAVSLLSWAPVHAADGLVFVLRLVRHLPFMDFATEPFVQVVDMLHPFLKFLFDLTFSFGIAQGLAMLVNTADERAQQKLVLMSMSVSRMMREGPVDDGATAGAAAAAPSLAAAAAAVSAAAAAPSGGACPAPMEVDGGGGGLGVGGAAGGSGDAPVPTWTEDGTWSLFE